MTSLRQLDVFVRSRPHTPTHPHTTPSVCVCVCRYDKKDTSKITLTDLQLLAAMGPPGGGRNPITARFLRHFNVISINEFNDETMTRIFSAIVQFYLKVRS